MIKILILIGFSLIEYLFVNLKQTIYFFFILKLLFLGRDDSMHQNNIIIITWRLGVDNIKCIKKVTQPHANP